MRMLTRNVEGEVRAFACSSNDFRHLDSSRFLFRRGLRQRTRKVRPEWYDGWNGSP